MRTRRVLVLVAAVVAIGSGAAVAAAELIDDQPGDVIDGGSDAIMPPVDGAKPVFGDDVGAVEQSSWRELSDGATMRFVKATDSEVCFDLQLGDGTSYSGCDARTTIATGLAYAEFGNSITGTIDVVGVVPDDVAKVEINRIAVPIRDNVWHYVTRSGDPVSVRVIGRDGRVVELE